MRAQRRRAHHVRCITNVTYDGFVVMKNRPENINLQGTLFNVITFSDESSTHRIVNTALEVGVSRAPAGFPAFDTRLGVWHTLYILSRNFAINHQPGKSTLGINLEHTIDFSTTFKNVSSTHVVSNILSSKVVWHPFIRIWSHLQFLTHVMSVWRTRYILSRNFAVNQEPGKSIPGHESWMRM